MPVDIDIVQTAGSYAEVSGVLAGFGITLLVLIYEGDPEDATPGRLPNLRDLAIPLLAILILMNGAATIMWGFITGMGGASVIRIWTLAYYAGYISTLAVVIAVLSIQTIVPINLVAAQTIRRLFTAAIAVLCVLGMMLATVMLLTVQQSAESVLEAVAGNTPLLAGILVLYLVVIAVGIAIGLRTVWGRTGPNSPPSFLAYCAVLVTAVVLNAIGFGTTGLLLPGTTLSTVGLIAMTALWALLVGWGQIFLLD